jgi:hypothetical protein
MPFLVVGGSFLPIFVFRYGEEGNGRVFLRDPDDRGDKFDEKPRNGQQTRIERFKVVDNKSFYMTSVVILISHYHQMSIAQRFCILVLFAMLQTHDLSNSIDFNILHNHIMGSISHIEKFSTKWEDYF